MADLRKMFPVKKDDSNGLSPAPQATATPVGPRPNPFARIASSGQSATEPESVQRASQGAQGAGEVAQEQPDNQPAAPRLATIFGNKSGGVRGAASPAAESGKPKFAGLAAGAGSRDSNPADAGATGIVLGDLSDLDALADIEPVRDDSTATLVRSSFPDETPATAPTRELPADLDKSAQAFVGLCDSVYGMIHDVELLSNVIRSIMVELQTNPQYIKLIVREDVRTWVRAMRDGMGLARIKKQEKKSGAGRKSKSKAATDADVLSALDDLGIDLDNA